MSYLAFLIFFVVVPALILAVAAWIRAKRRDHLKLLRWHWIGTGILALIAFLWTTPWDNYIVANGVWSYGEERVIAVVGYVPIEEYLFFILMPLLNSAFFALFFLGTPPPTPSFKSSQKRSRLLLSFASLLIFGIFTFLLSREPFTYLATTIVWFLPPLWIQWVFNPGYLRKTVAAVAVSTLVPATYLCLADAWAIHDGIWTIHVATRTGWHIGGLPFEEAFFFFITSLLLAQGLTLWHSLRST